MRAVKSNPHRACSRERRNRKATFSGGLLRDMAVKVLPYFSSI